MGIALLVSLRAWEWKVPYYLKALLVKGLSQWRQQTVTVHFFYSPSTISQIEHSLLNLKDDLAQMEKAWGVRFHILITLPDNLLDEEDKSTQVLERRFPELSFLYERG